MENSNIEWTTHTFNSWWGCVEVGSQCDNCYAKKMDARFGESHWGRDAPRRFMSESYWKKPIKWNSDAEKAGVRRRVFAHSMSDWAEILDILHPDFRQMYDSRQRLMTLIENTPKLDWLLLTKRIKNVVAITQIRWIDGEWPTNAHVGISVGNQEEGDRDIPKLLEIPAPVRFLSIEPMLGAIDLWGARYKNPNGGLTGAISSWNPSVQWVIAGGESGSNARPSHPDWFRRLRDDCVDAGVPFLFKQWGEYFPQEDKNRSEGMGHYCDHSRCWRGHGEGVAYARIGKKAAGRVLDGRTWDEFPKEFSSNDKGKL